MIYEVKYRCFIKYHQGSPAQDPSPFPFLEIKYRKKGNWFWESMRKQHIDSFAYERFKNTYYKDFSGGYSVSSKLAVVGDYLRLYLFNRILTDEFHGSLRNFVMSIVEEKVCLELAEKDEMADAGKLAFSFVTKGWETAEINIERKGDK